MGTGCKDTSTMVELSRQSSNIAIGKLPKSRLDIQMSDREGCDRECCDGGRRYEVGRW